MRTYSNFLLFEEILLDLPTTSPVLVNAFQSLLSPYIDIVEEDCGTLLGENVDISFAIEGLIELATGIPLTHSRIIQLMTSGASSVAIRTQHSCNSVGGLCRQCYLSNIINRGNTVNVEERIPISPMYYYQTDIIPGDGSTTYPLTEIAQNYDALVVVQNGSIIPSSTYTVFNDNIILGSVTSDPFLVYFVKISANPFLGYISNTYSGSLLGLSPLPTEQLLIKESLYLPLLNEGFLRILQREIENFKDIPYNMLQYVGSISDPMERALYIFYLYAIYGSLN